MQISAQTIRELTNKVKGSLFEVTKDYPQVEFSCDQERTVGGCNRDTIGRFFSPEAEAKFQTSLYYGRYYSARVVLLTPDEAQQVALALKVLEYLLVHGGTGGNDFTIPTELLDSNSDAGGGRVISKAVSESVETPF